MTTEERPEGCKIAGFEGGKRGPRIQDVVDSKSWKRQENEFFPITSRKKKWSSADTLLSPVRDLRGTSGLQTYKTVKLC